MTLVANGVRGELQHQADTAEFSCRSRAEFPVVPDAGKYTEIGGDFLGSQIQSPDIDPAAWLPASCFPARPYPVEG